MDSYLVGARRLASTPFRALLGGERILFIYRIFSHSFFSNFCRGIDENRPLEVSLAEQYMAMLSNAGQGRKNVRVSRSHNRFQTFADNDINSKLPTHVKSCGTVGPFSANACRRPRRLSQDWRMISAGLGSSNTSRLLRRGDSTTNRDFQPV